MRKMKFVILTVGLLFALVSTSQAAPVTPLPFGAGVNTGYYVESYSNLENSHDWFVFESNGVDATYFWFDRTEAPPDLYAALYRGDVTGFDFVPVVEGNVYFWRGSAHTYNRELSYVGSWDDSHNDSFGGPFGDPHFTILLPAGVYSLALGTLQNAGGYQFETNQTSLPIDSDPCDLNVNGNFDPEDVLIWQNICLEETEGSWWSRKKQCFIESAYWAINDCGGFPESPYSRYGR